MALELSELKFVVDDSDLKRASDTIGNLVTNVGKLDKAARDAAQTEAVLAKAAKLNADANLQNAKAQDVRLKSTITADKADQQATAAIEKKTKATEKVNEVVNKNVGVLQRQKDILEFQTQGFSKGQSSILAYGKAAGLAAEGIGELGKVLETQRKLMGGDPFDKSLSGLKSLQNQYTELKESVRQYATDSNLTAKQTRELARDKERLIEKMKVEGASFSEIRKAVRAHNDEYVNLATSYNKMTSAEDAVIKSRKDAVNATNYLTQADQKMAAALNTSNAALDKAGTDSLVKYETALRKSGVSQDAATLKLAKYKAQLEQVQIQEQKRREQHLTRALAPQATDVVVSLWSGQNPLTVLLQQGGQVTDLFMQSGIAAEKFGEVVKSSMKSMLPSILTVVKGVGGLLVDGFVAAGNAVSSFLANSVGMTGALDKLYMKMSENGPSKWGGVIRGLSSLMSGVFAIGIAGVVTGLVALGVAFKNAIEEGAELNRNLELTGASLALTKSSALELAQSLASSERPVAKVVDVINELAKAGKFSSENIALVTNAAIDLERYGKVSIAETAKELSKLREDPVKALLEVAEKTGYVNLETIATIKSLRDQGKMAEAAELAMKAWATSSTSAATSIKNQMSPLEQVWDTILGKINQVVGALQKVARGSSLAQQIADKEAQLASVKGGFFTSTFGLSPKGSKDVDRLSEEIYMLKLQLQAETDITKERAKRSSAAAQLKAEAEATKEYTTALEKQASKELTLSAFVKKAVEERTKVVASALGKNVEDVKLSAEAIDKITKGAELQWKEQRAKPDRQGIKDLETEIDLRNEELGLLGSFNNELDAIERRRAKSGNEDQYQKSLNALIEKQPVYLERQKEINAAHDLTNKLFGKADMLGKDYYKTLEQIQKSQDSGLYSPEQAERLRQAAFDQTELAKQQLKYVEESTKVYVKYAEESQKSLDNSTLENQKLDERLKLLGLTSEEQKHLKIQQQQRNALLGVDLRLTAQIAKIWEDVRQGKLDPFDAMAAQLEAEKAAAEERKTINREVVVAYKEDFDKEFRAIKSGITDSIVTALFEGGKAGSKKLRDVLVNVLRQKVTMVVDVGVNALLNSVIGGTVSSLAGSAGSSLLGSIGGSALTGVAGQALGIGTASSLVGGFTGSIIPASMVGPSVAAPTLMSGLGNMASAIPGWGLAIAGIAALASIFSKKSTPHMGAGSEFSSTGGLRALSGEWNETAQKGVGIGWQQDEKTQSLTNTIAQTIVTMLDSTAKTFGKEAGFSAATAFADDTSKDGAWGGLVIKQLDEVLVDWKEGQTSKWAPKVFSDGEAGVKEYQNAVASSVLSVLKEMELPAWAKQFTDALPDEGTLEDLQRVFTTIANYPNELLAKFGVARDELVNTFVEAVKSGKGAQAGNLVAQQFLAGVEESMLGATSGAIFDIVNQNIITPIIDALLKGATVSEALSKATVEDAISRAGELASAYNQLTGSAEWKDLMNQLESTISKPLNQIGGQLSYIPQYAVPAVEAVSDLNSELEDLAKKSEDITKQLKERAYDLEIERLRLIGQEEEALRMERDRAIIGFNEMQIAMWDANKAASDYNTSLKAQRSLMDEGNRLAIDLLRLQGHEEAALNAERHFAIKGMDEQQIALWDANKAAAKYNNTLKEQQDSMKRLAGMVPSIMSKYLSPEAFKSFQYNELAQKLAGAGLIPTTAIEQMAATLMGASKDDIASFVMDFLKTVELTTQQKEALYEVVDALGTLKNEAADAAKTITDAFKGVGDDLVAYIRELATGRAGLATPTELLAKTRQNYQSDYSAAMGGDLEAAQRLADSAKQYIEAQKTVSASSQTTNDVIRMVMQQLSSLGFVKDILNSSGAMTIPQFANGGAFTNSIVSQPTLFNMGQMGESGPEAIMPLSRTSSGSLGVTAVSGKTDELLRTLIEEIRALREQQSGETSAQVNATLAAAERVAEEVSETVSENSWKASTKPALV